MWTIAHLLIQFHFNGRFHRALVKQLVKYTIYGSQGIQYTVRHSIQALEVVLVCGQEPTNMVPRAVWID